MRKTLERLRAQVKDLQRSGPVAASEAVLDKLVEELDLVEIELAVQHEELVASHRRHQAHHEHYQQLFESVPVGLVRVDAEGLVEDINDAACRMFGVDPRWREAAPVRFSNLLPAASQVAWARLTSSAGGAERAKVLGARGPLLAELRTVPWRGAGGGFLVLVHDVTELSEARARQAEAEERLGHIVRRMSDGLVVIDATTGLIEEHNDAFAEMLGRPGESLVGLAHESLFLPESRTAEALKCRQAIRDGRQQTQLRYAYADGTVRTAEVTVGSLHAVEYLVVRDVTAQLRAQEEQRTVEARLAQTQKLEALGLLASGVAHDMNNVLAAVLTATELPPTPETLADLRAAALRGRELTERLLAVSRRKPLRREAFDLVAVVNEVVALARRTFPREIAVVWAPPAAPWFVEGDAGQWHQALLNLLINARDALAGAGRIEVVAKEDDTGPAISVVDDGCGMDDAVLRRVFEPFFSTKGEAGTGLGLAHVRAVAAAHGGSVSIESALGKGTTVRVGVRKTAARPETARPRMTVVQPQTRRSALVVDDEPSLLRMTKRLLERLGWQVETADGVRGAIRALERRSFDVLLTDRSMPELTGDQLCRAARCRWPATAVAVVTGLADDLEREALTASGVDAILAKPFRGDELGETLASLAPDPSRPPNELPCGLPRDAIACAESCTRGRSAVTGR